MRAPSFGWKAIVMLVTATTFFVLAKLLSLVEPPPGQAVGLQHVIASCMAAAIGFVGLVCYFMAPVYVVLHLVQRHRARNESRRDALAQEIERRVGNQAGRIQVCRDCGHPREGAQPQCPGCGCRGWRSTRVAAG